MIRRPLGIAAFLLLSASFGLVPAQAADLKIGFVNTERVIREAPAAIKAGRKMEQEFGARNQELQRMATDLQAKQSFLADKGATLSESQRRAKESELNDLSVTFQRRQREFQEDLRFRQNEESSAIIEKANQAIIRIAESEHFDLILQEAVFAGTSLDITDKVIKALSGD